MSRRWSKLLPIAKPHTLVLDKEAKKYDCDERGPRIVIRLTPEFRQQVANLYHLVVENDLAYAVWDLKACEAAWIIQYHYHHEDYAKAHSQLYVSREQLWVLSSITRYSWGDDTEETVVTKRIPIESISPVKLLSKGPVSIPTIIDTEKLSLPKKRIQAFLDAERAYDIISDAMYRHEYPAPDDHLILLDRLRGGDQDEGPLAELRDAWHRMEDDLERWERTLDAERETICGQALGIAIGDSILSESSKGPTRIKVERMDTHVTEDDKLTFSLSGPRYRKDGLPGKREDCLYIQTSNKID